METRALESEGLLDEDRRTVVISVNPNSGSTDQSSVVESLAEKLIGMGFEVHVMSDIEVVKSTVNGLSGPSDSNGDLNSGSDSRAMGCGPLLRREVTVRFRCWPIACPPKRRLRSCRWVPKTCLPNILA